MRLVLACSLFLVACHRGGAPEPAWPESAGHVAPDSWEDDGGESLEPRGDTMIEDSTSGDRDPDAEPEPEAVTNVVIDEGTTTDEMIIDDEEPVPTP